MFIWAAARFQLSLLSYECPTEGTKLIELDRTEIFTRLHFHPVVRVACDPGQKEIVEARTRPTLQAAQKYSLVANCVKSEVVIDAEILGRRAPWRHRGSTRSSCYLFLVRAVFSGGQDGKSRAVACISMHLSGWTAPTRDSGMPEMAAHWLLIILRHDPRRGASLKKIGLPQ
jgi:hypothetical protein